MSEGHCSDFSLAGGELLLGMAGGEPQLANGWWYPLITHAALPGWQCQQCQEHRSGQNLLSQPLVMRQCVGAGQGRAGQGGT